jgi:chromosome segregation and condensation protein ScpB
MNRELETLLEALDAAAQARGEESIRLREAYEAHLAELLENPPNLSRSALELAVSVAYSRWKKAQEKFPSLPPRA